MRRRSLLAAAGLALLDWPLVVHASQRRADEAAIRLRFPDGVDLTGLSIEYYLSGPFGGYGSFIRTDRDRREYTIDISRNGETATTLKAIIYCPGYRIVLLNDPMVATRADSAVSIELEPLGSIPFSGRLVSAPARLPAWRSLRVEVQYIAYWAHAFYGIPDGIVTQFKVAEAELDADGRFMLSVPDFASDPVETAFGGHVLESVFQLALREVDTGNFPYRIRNVDAPDEPWGVDLPIAGDYPQELLITGVPE